MSTRPARLHALCTPDHWAIEPVLGLDPGVLVTLRCAEDHLHHASRAATYRAARAAIRVWMRRTFGERHPGLPIEDYTRMRLILPDGRQWPLAPRSER